MNKTSIEWVKNSDGTQGYTWNPITGCLNGCPYCYARKLANGRLRSRYLANREIAPIGTMIVGAAMGEKVLKDPFYPRFWNTRIQDPDRKDPDGKARGIFVCDMSDLFGIGIPEEWTAEVLWHTRFNPNDRFYLLTKQPQNLEKWSPFPPNCYVGVTATDEPSLVNACQELHYIEATVKFLSVEPLLNWFQDFITYGVNYWLKYGSVGQVIIGAQTKPYKPPKWEWVSEIINACVKANIPYFLKNNLEPIVPKAFGGDGELIQELPDAR